MTVILYHFTNEKNLDSIMAEGIKPSGYDTTPPYRVVWLTRSETPTWTLDPRKRWACRLRIVVRHGDRKLVKWESWMRKHYRDVYDELMQTDRIFRKACPTTWCYFDTIPPTAVREITHCNYDMVIVD